MSPRVIMYGGWGMPTPPPFAYDLTRGDTYRQARRSRLGIDDPSATSYNAIRLGPKPHSEDDDTRPLVPAYFLSDELSETLNRVESWNASLANSLAQLGVSASDYGLAYMVGQPNLPVTISSRDTWIPAGLAFWLQGHLFKVANQNNNDQQVWGFWWGTAGNGYVFRLQRGRPAIARLSREWTVEDQLQMAQYWRGGATSQAAVDLAAKIFEDFDELSLERKIEGRDRDTWYGNDFTLAFIPEPRGVLHVVLQGADAVAHEWTGQLKKRDTTDLWGASRLTIFSVGGGFNWRCGLVGWAASMRLRYGPFRHGYWEDELDQLTYDTQVSEVEEHSSLELARTPDTTISSYFDATATTDGTAPVFVYGLNARIPAGPRSGPALTDDNITFDTTDLYTPANPASPRETGNPIMDIQPSWDGENRARTALVTMRDVNGWVSATFGTNETSQPDIPAAIGRVTSITIDGNPFMTGGMVVEARHLQMGKLTQNISPLNTARSDSQLAFTIRDGWHILEQMTADVCVIGDGRYPGEVIRDLLRMAGYDSASWAGVPVNVGRRLPRAALGEDWACVTERGATIADAIRRIVDCYCLGYVFYQNLAGNWVLEKPSTAVQGAFSSSAATNNPGTQSGRRTVLDGLERIMDPSGFYNHFRVVGGDDGNEIVQEWTNWESIRDRRDPSFIGYKKSYREHRDPGLRTPDDVQYVLRSLVTRYGKPGRRWVFPTYFDHRPIIGYRYTFDDLLAEFEGITGGSLANDQMQCVIREVV